MKGILAEGGGMAVCYRNVCVALTMLMIAGGAGSTANADDCLSSTDGIAVTCIGSARQSGLQQLFSNDPAYGRLDSRLAGQSWISNEWAAAPFALSPLDSNFSMKMSTGHLGTFTDQTMLRRFEEAKALAPDGMIMPKPTIGPRNNKFDVWTTLNASSANLAPDQSLRGGVGADYKFNRNTVVGVAMDFRDGVGNSDVLSEHGRTLATYFAYKPAPALTFDTTAQWGQSAGSVSGEGFGAEQNSVQARMRGNWNIDRLKFTPTIAFSHGTEHLNATDGNASATQSAVTVAPRVSRSFTLDGGQTLEPFLQYQTDIAVGSPDFDAGGGSDITRSAGAGVTFINPNAYSLSVTTGVEGINQEQPNVSSKLRVTVPLK